MCRFLWVGQSTLILQPPVTHAFIRLYFAKKLLNAPFHITFSYQLCLIWLAFLTPAAVLILKRVITIRTSEYQSLLFNKLKNILYINSVYFGHQSLDKPSVSYTTWLWSWNHLRVTASFRDFVSIGFLVTESNIIIQSLVIQECFTVKAKFSDRTLESTRIILTFFRKIQKRLPKLWWLAGAYTTLSWSKKS